MNWGGFVNRSFRVTDGQSSYHPKLTSDSDTARGLKRWRALANTLTNAYHAPAMRGWVDVPGTDLAGPMFEWIDGLIPGRLGEPLRTDVVRAGRRLHADHRLGQQLQELGDAMDSCAGAYFWMADEIDALAEQH